MYQHVYTEVVPKKKIKYKKNLLRNLLMHFYTLDDQCLKLKILDGIDKQNLMSILKSVLVKVLV